MAELDAAQVKEKRASATATIWSKFIRNICRDPGECKRPMQ